jgi:HlyD family secretion protein
MIRRFAILFVLAGLIIGGVYLYRTLTQSGELVVTGIVTTHEVNVSPMIQGRLNRLLVREGDTVKAGDLLALIDPQELQADRSFYIHAEQGAAAQVEQEKASLVYQETLIRDQVRQAEAALSTAEAQAKEITSELELNRINYDRAQNLYQKQVASKQALDEAKTAYEAGKARSESLVKQVEAQRAAVAVAHANENQIAVRLKELDASRTQLQAAGAQKSKAEVRLGYAEIRAPIGGIVSVLAVRQGEVLTVSQPVLTLIDPDDLWVRADIEETYADRIRPGDRFPVRLPSGEMREGTVFYRAVDADFATQRDVSRSKRDIKTFELRLRVDNKDRRLWPGLTAYVLFPFTETVAAAQAAK